MLTYDDSSALAMGKGQKLNVKPDRAPGDTRWGNENIMHKQPKRKEIWFRLVDRALNRLGVRRGVILGGPHKHCQGGDEREHVTVQISGGRKIHVYADGTTSSLNRNG
jgi:hypothetical protein